VPSPPFTALVWAQEGLEMRGLTASVGVVRSHAQITVAHINAPHAEGIANRFNIELITINNTRQRRFIWRETDRASI
jgi:hypothetical protein